MGNHISDSAQCTGKCMIHWASGSYLPIYSGGVQQLKSATNIHCVREKSTGNPLCTFL